MNEILEPLRFGTAAFALPLLQPAAALANELPAAGPVCSSASCDVKETGALTAIAPSRHLEILSTLRRIDWPEFGREAAGEAWSLGRWIIFAFVLEALITRYVPQAAVAAVLGAGNLFAIPLAAVIGMPLYLNSYSALPIVTGLLAQGMQPGAAVAFLIAGPLTTIPAMTAVYGTVHRRVFALYLAIGLLGAMVMDLLANVVLR